MTRKLLNFPLKFTKITYFILRITRILFAIIEKDLYHSNAYKMLQGKGRLKILNNKPDRGKSVRKNQNNSRIYLRKGLFYFANYAISIYASH